MSSILLDQDPNFSIFKTQIERGYKQYSEPKKRPFCNAFTGCGKKRSESAAGLQANNAPQNENPLLVDNNDDTLSTLIDLNAEPAVEDLMRQIMSEAKLWEAIQEAGREILIQKQNGKTSNQLPISFSTQ